MKSAKKIVAMLALIAMVATVLVSCKKDEKDDKIMGIDISQYTLVRPDSASDDMINITRILKEDILAYTGAELQVTTDASTAGEYEILVGETARAESLSALSGLKQANNEQAFFIGVNDKKIVIAGIDDTDTILGVKRFINSFVKTSTAKNMITAEVGYGNIEKTGKILYLTDRYDAVVVERTTNIFRNTTPDKNISCSKIIKLEHSGENNGILLATHETYDGSAPGVYRSTDDGKTWELWSNVTDTLNNETIGYQSYIYELPEAVGEYPAGTLVFGGCTRTDKTTKMVFYISTDAGKNWTTVCNVDEGYGFNDGGWSSDGIWEPVFMYENGRLYCFYSDERDNGTGADHIGGHNQKLVYKYTTDMKSWSDMYDCTASTDSNLRPGMVTLAKMSNGKWALAYEVCNATSEVGCPIYIKYADTLDGWDVDDIGTPVKDEKGGAVGSSPAIAWTPSGGENGILFLMAHHGKNYANGCDLLISFDYGETFVTIESPLPVVRTTSDSRCGYNPGFFVDAAGDVYYVNNPENFKGVVGENLAFAKIKVY